MIANVSINLAMTGIVNYKFYSQFYHFMLKYTRKREVNQ